MKEDNALGRVVISKIEATIKIKGMSEEGNGYIKIGDAIVGIDDDDTTDWPLSRIRGRLGPSRLPPGGSVTFIFERRDPIEEEQEEGGGDEGAGGEGVGEGREDGAPPPVDLSAERLNGDFVRDQINAGAVTACHDLSDGGLAAVVLRRVDHPHAAVAGRFHRCRH